VDIRTAYYIIPGCPNSDKVKAIIASCLLQLQYEADDGSDGKIFEDQ